MEQLIGYWASACKFGVGEMTSCSGSYLLYLWRSGASILAGGLGAGVLLSGRLGTRLLLKFKNFQLLRQFLYIIFISNNRTSFHFW